MTRLRFRALAFTMAAAFVAFACGGNSPGNTGATLASDQTFRFPILDDVQTLDPADVSSGVDISFTQEVFSGLFAFDNQNNVVPNIASGQPTVSSDGLTYTFKLKSTAKFSNGDAITSADFVYSWNRAAHRNGDYATFVFAPIQGGEAVLDGKATSISGVTAPDPTTLKVVLLAPEGYFTTVLALWTADVIDQKVVTKLGDDKWWTTADGLVGSGPFKMTGRVPKASLDFAPVANWWNGATGALKAIHVDVGIDQASQVKKFEAGGYDAIGPANGGPGPDDVIRFKGDPTKSSLLHLYPASRTTWIGFNELKGPFTGVDAGKAGRIAFSQAVDRSQIVDVACAKGATCIPATGGLITKGLKGYLGDNADTTAKFDAAAAKAAYTQWDPTGSKVKGLAYSYNASAGNTKAAENLASQWQANLGVKVSLSPSDFPTLISARKAKTTIIFRDSWGADYDHPSDWYDALFSCAEAPPGKGNLAAYCNKQFDALVKKADAEQLTQAIPEFVTAGKMLVADGVYGAWNYGVAAWLTQTYVSGEGYNGLYDYDWTGVKILKH